MKLKLLASIVTGIVLTIVILLLGYFHFWPRTGSLVVDPAPTDSKIVIDGKTIRANQPIQLRRGHKTVSLSRTGFVTQQFSVDVKPGKKSVLQAVLKVDINYLKTGSQLNFVANDSLTSAQIEDLGGQIANQTPIINLLPYVSSDFRVDYGVSQKNPNSLVDQAIYITAPTDAGKQAALKWIKDKGFDPSKLEIIYQDSIPEPKTLD